MAQVARQLDKGRITKVRLMPMFKAKSQELSFYD
jgi:hypothetical protein